MDTHKIHFNLKHTGVRHSVFDDFFERLYRNSEFHCIISEQAVKYYFQPIFDARSGDVYAYEALMRVDFPYFKSPDKVIDFARAKHRLKDVEKLTFFKATDTYRKLREQGALAPDAYIFINSIGSVCLDKKDSEKFFNKFSDITDNIVVEITETENMNLDMLQAKRDSPGFSGMFALDDYGSGCSMAQTLIALRPHFIKIDMSLIQGIDKNVDKQHIVTNIVDYAHQRNMMVVAEGIETSGELMTSIDLGADLLQGYYLARPAAIPSDIKPTTLDIIRRLNNAAAVHA